MQVFLSYIPKTQQRLANRLIEAFHDSNSPSDSSSNITPLSFNLKKTYAEVLTDCLDRTPFNSDRFIVIVSKDYSASEWHTKELHAFCAKEMQARDKGLIVPILAENVRMPPLIDTKTAVCTFDGVQFETAFASLVKHLRESHRRPARVFVVMRFPDPSQKDPILDPLLKDAYDKAIAPAITAAGYKPTLMHKIDVSGSIPVRILEEIKASDIVLADLTGERPNCYFEAGFAQGLGKKMILTIEASRKSKVHFSLAGNQCIYWSNPDELHRLLTEKFDTIKKEREQEGQKASLEQQERDANIKRGRQRTNADHGKHQEMGPLTNAQAHPLDQAEGRAGRRGGKGVTKKRYTSTQSTTRSPPPKVLPKKRKS
jgi:nucleoside 2-deoxyribosyltransferase